ncbi:hypothetical protein HYN59_09260 [Flavobacterium album]|uniref:Secretion system C-terminal sorting domain-containing protein n=1 Tax=Flavobacterium album TaxID=2175091 RepID=A0A2S1QY40_9FLAO|nr:T9SS type A sorting domain-containing protein [Flavobacterium album]AWH85294.1 hypothetical protein HYN59_09260 [Flavobacterium album]
MKKIITLLAMAAGTSLFSQTFVLDATFADNGIKVFQDESFYPRDVKLINSKYYFIGTGNNFIDGNYCKITKLNYNGSKDDSFGTGGDKILSVPGETFSLKGFKYSNGSFYIYGKSVTPTESSDIVIAKLDENGNYDVAFGTNGIAKINLGGNEELADLVFDASNNLFCTGSRSVEGSPTVARLITFKITENGTLDTSFDPSGYKEYHINSASSGNFITNYAGGYILAGNESHYETVEGSSQVLHDDLLLVKINADGVPVTSFGTNGYKLLPLQTNYNNTINKVQLHSNAIFLDYISSWSFQNTEREIVSFDLATDEATTINNSYFSGEFDVMEDGIYSTGAFRCMQANPPCDSNFELRRINFDGTVDTTFHINGLYSYSWPGTLYSSAISYTLNKDDNGKILMAGYLNRAYVNNNGQMAGESGFTLLRLVEGELSTKDTDGPAASIYPNPFSDRLTIQSGLDIKEIAIFDMSGRKVGIPKVTNEAGSYTIYPNLNQNGVYLLRAVTADGQEIVEKIVKQ